MNTRTALLTALTLTAPVAKSVVVTTSRRGCAVPRTHGPVSVG